MTLQTNKKRIKKRMKEELVYVLVVVLGIGLIVGLVTQINIYLTLYPLFSGLDFWACLIELILVLFLTEVTLVLFICTLIKSNGGKREHVS